MIDEWSIEFTTMLGVDVSVNCQLESEFHCGSIRGSGRGRATNGHDLLLRRAAAVDPLMGGAVQPTVHYATLVKSSQVKSSRLRAARAVCSF